MSRTQAAAARTSIDIGIFAHDEEDGIGALIADLGRQTALAAAGLDLRVLVLANGCSDATVPRAAAAIAALPSALADRFEIVDLAQGGKSRTAHDYIHRLARRDAALLGFMDADIRLPEPDTLARMAAALLARPELLAFTSRPVKDVVHHRLQVGRIARLVAAGGDGLTDYRKSICGQLFLLRGDTARRLGLPAGLPVEDGFIRAMVLTDLLSRPEDLSRIDGDPGVFHVYESIRTLRGLLRHQIRIVAGSAVNAALFARIRREAPDAAAAQRLLMAAAADPDWLRRVLREDLPRFPYGYVPFHFLGKRLQAFRRAGRRGLKPLAMLGAGLGLDALAYLGATRLMIGGRGAGFW